MNLALAVRPYIEFATTFIETLATIIIFSAIAYGVVRYAIDGVLRGQERAGYQAFKVRLGSALLLGLEILVAADVVRTVALEPSITNVIVLGLLVLIRTFLSWSLVVEIEGRWPWQKELPSAEAK